MVDLVSAIQPLADLLKQLVEGRGVRERRRLLGTMREPNSANPAALHFSVEGLSKLTGLPEHKVRDRLSELERAGVVVRWLDRYFVRDRPGSGRPTTV